MIIRDKDGNIIARSADGVNWSYRSSDGALLANHGSTAADIASVEMEEGERAILASLLNRGSEATAWECDRCRASGEVRHSADADVMTVAHLIEDDHRKQSTAIGSFHSDIDRVRIATHGR